MYRIWILCFALTAMAGCDSGTEMTSNSGGDKAARLAGSYSVEQRCNELGPAVVDFTARGQGGNYYLLVRGGNERPVYAAVDRLELGMSWNNDTNAFETASDGLPLHDWRTHLTKEAGWLKDEKGVFQLPEEAQVAYDSEQDIFFFESECVEEARATAHMFRHSEQRLVLHALNVVMAEERAKLYQEAGLRYIEQRRNYQGGSGADGISEGHQDRNQHLLNVASLMREDAENEVPELATLIAEHRPADSAAARRYEEELPAYLRAAARAHAHWYIDAADIRLDWFNGNYPDGEAAIRDGIAALEDAYLGLAE